MLSIAVWSEKPMLMQVSLLSVWKDRWCGPNSPICCFAVDEYQTNLTQARQRWEKFKALLATTEEQSLIEQYDKADHAWGEVSDQILKGRTADTREGRRLALDLTLGEAKQKFEAMRDNLDKLTELNLSIAHAESQSAESTYSHTKLMLISIIALGIVVGIGLALFIAISITNQVNAAVAGLKDIAEGEGDLTKRLAVRSTDEVGELSKWFNTFLEKLQEMVSQIMRNARSVSQAASNLMTISDDMNAGADRMSGRSNTVAVSLAQGGPTPSDSDPEHWPPQPVQWQVSAGPERHCNLPRPRI